MCVCVSKSLCVCVCVFNCYWWECWCNVVFWFVITVLLYLLNALYNWLWWLYTHLGFYWKIRHSKFSVLLLFLLHWVWASCIVVLLVKWLQQDFLIFLLQVCVCECVCPHLNCTDWNLLYIQIFTGVVNIAQSCWRKYLWLLHQAEATVLRKSCCAVSWWSGQSWPLIGWSVYVMIWMLAIVYHKECWSAETGKKKLPPLRICCMFLFPCRSLSGCCGTCLIPAAGTEIKTAVTVFFFPLSGPCRQPRKRRWNVLEDMGPGTVLLSKTARLFARTRLMRASAGKTVSVLCWNQGSKFQLVWWSMTTESAYGPVGLCLPLVRWTSNLMTACWFVRASLMPASASKNSECALMKPGLKIPSSPWPLKVPVDQKNSVFHWSARPVI